MRRQFGIMGLIGAGAFLLGGMAAFASGDTSAVPFDGAQPPAIATSVVTITAAAPSLVERSDDVGMTADAQTAPFGYSYVVYFPVGGADLTAPANDMLAAIADEVTGLELSRVTLSNDAGPDARTQVVRDALIELGVPARWIGEAPAAPAAIGPVSMAPLNI
ncbi:hypothetical protein [Pyruvatibacter sp.]|uniref:hypothetical protein n=1 Tax=Pyruvatibacter sp. TaxID=1981328 RepID=UPI0032EB1949